LRGKLQGENAKNDENAAFDSIKLRLGQSEFLAELKERQHCNFAGWGLPGTGGHE